MQIHLDCWAAGSLLLYQYYGVYPCDCVPGRPTSFDVSGDIRSSYLVGFCAFCVDYYSACAQWDLWALVY